MCGSVLGSALPAPSHYSWKVHHPDQTELWNQSVIMQLFGHSTFQFCSLGCIHEVSNLFGTFNVNVLSCHTNVIYFWKVQLHYVLFMKWKCLDNLNPVLDISTYLLLVRIVFWWAITRLSLMLSANVSGVWFQMILFAVITTWHSYLDLHFSTSTADLLTPTRHGGKGRPSDQPDNAMVWELRVWEDSVFCDNKTQDHYPAGSQARLPDPASCCCLALDI